MLVPLLLLASHIRGRPDQIPPLAKIFGIRVGRNGRGRLEREFGIGAYSISGHPNGAEVWILSKPYSELGVDGFSYTAHEDELIEALTWSHTPESHLKPNGVVSRSRGWLGAIVLGMPAEQAIRIAERKLGKAKRASNDYTWTQRGWSHPSLLQLHDPFQVWKASMTVEGGRVTGIAISCP